jgi:hypothetical protein
MDNTQNESINHGESYYKSGRKQHLLKSGNTISYPPFSEKDLCLSTEWFIAAIVSSIGLWLRAVVLLPSHA